MISRHKLYAMGEAFGDCATHAKPGGHGRIYGGASSSSTSKSDNTTNNVSTTTTQDRRQVVDSGAGAVNADKSNVALTINSTDDGATTAAINGVVSATQHLADQGTAMLQANTSLANSIQNSGAQVTLKMLDDVTSLTNGLLAGVAANQTTASNLALEPMQQQNPDRYLIIGALAVVAVVAFAVMSKGKI